MRVSDFKLVDPARERARLLAALEEFNRTTHPYDRDRSLHSVLEDRMQAAGPGVAVVGDDGALTYPELLTLSGRIASWLGPSKVAGVLMENTPDMIAAVLGTLRAGAVYLPINPDLPLDRIATMLTDTGAQVLLTERRFAREANRLQWECPQLTRLLCLDSESFRDEEESASELSRLDLWEYVGEEATDAISGGGWRNSYTGHDLSPEIMAEYADNTAAKLRPLLSLDSRVLEIGCSSGLTMFRLAPHCRFYYGIDFSKTILAKTRAEVERLGLQNIRLDVLAAHDVDHVPERDFDLIVINSVAQNFNGHNYLRQILLKAAQLLRPEGRIFLGDLMDQDRKRALIESLVEFQRENAGKGYVTKTDWSAELFISRDWIEDVCLDFPGVASAEHSEKIHTISNELTEFRFDSLITIRGTGCRPGLLRHKYQASRPDLNAFPPDPPLALVPPEQAAYIIFTSGTTGRPKGVAVSHRSIHNYVQWAARYYFADGSGNMALFTSPAADLTLTSIFVPLYLGRTVRAFRNRDVDKLLEAVFTSGVDTIKLTPSHISILDTLTIQPAPIRVAIVGGEDLTPDHVETLRRHAPGVRIYNEYGPTEATIGCTACQVGDPPVHIGKPIDNTEIWILDSGGELKPIGTPGELCVAGDCLANGYWGDQDLTERKFVPHPVRPGERIYRTGDLARWMPGGNLTLQGRADHQVKIRGNRVELGEIEAALRQSPGVRDAVVLAREDARGEKTLCAYLIPTGEVDLQAARSGLARVLPEFLIPSHFAVLNEFPLSLNGKLDRKRLPEPEAIALARGAEYEAPATDTEKALAEIWRDVLGVSRAGARDNFFELGGHSLKATQVVSRVHRTLEATLELRQVFRNPTLRAMAAAIDSARKFRFSAIDPLAPAKDYELSHAQRRLWILQQIDAESIAYNIEDAMEIEGPLNVPALVRAFESLVQRHESLRTIIVSTPTVPRQKIVDVGHGSSLVLGPQGWSPAPQPFDLSRGPLMRVRLLQLAPQLHRLFVTMHHVVSDGWSAGVMVRELLALYQGKELPPLRIQYKDYAAWQNRILESADEHARYWHDRLRGPLAVVDLPADFPRPAIQSFQGASLSFRMSSKLTAALQHVAKREQASLFMLLNAAVKALIFRLTGTDDIILGVPVAGRTHVDLENQIGFFVNTLALRDDVREHEGFRDLLSRVRRTTMEAFEHQVYPFDRLVNELALDRDTGRSPLFDVMLVLHNNQQPEIAVEGLLIRPVATDAQVSRFDLTFHFFEVSDGLTTTIEYATSLFLEQRIRRLWACFERLLESAMSDLSKPLAELDVVPERQQVIADFNQTGAPWEQPLAMFREQVALRPHQPAVVCANRSLTYRELDARTGELAETLPRGEIVAVRLNRSEQNLIALLACLKAGCAYLPIDPSYPEERVNAILENSKAHVILDDRGARTRACRVGTPADALAYVIYTSGSTGTPKGVAGTTQCLGNLISWQRRMIGDGLRSAQYAALGFDVSVQEMLYSACSGGTLYVAGDEERLDPARLHEFLKRHAIELVTMPFSGLNLLFATQTGLERLTSLKHLITSGEQLRLTPELRRFLEQRPDVRLHNQYGPSETHVVTSHTLSAQNLTALPPIGRPIANTRCYVLDRCRQPVAIGVTGELFLAGVNLAEGYLADPALTQRKFPPDPFHPGERMYQTGDLCRWREDGEIEFLGRSDDQVKIRGYRVEPGEVEVMLQSEPEVEAACVIAWKGELAAYYTSDHPIAESVLRERLARKLPPYMVPARFTQVEKMPLTPTGKVNRRALPDPVSAPAEPKPETLSPTEERVAEAFTAVLERARPGPNEDFFHLGGHSLLAVQIATRLQVPLITIFQRSTVRKLAEWIDGNVERCDYAALNNSAGPPLFALPPLLGYAMAFRRLAKLMPSHHVYGFDFVETPDLLDRYQTAITSLQPTGTVILFGYSGGGNLGFELAKHLEAAGHSVTLVLLDSFRLDSLSTQTGEQVQHAIQLNLDYFDRYLEADPKMRAFVTDASARAMLVKKMGRYLRYLDTIDNRGMIRGDIYLIESNEFAGDPRRAAWAQATHGSFQTVQGSGAHVEMILESHVAENAAIVERILADDRAVAAVPS